MRLARTWKAVTLLVTGVVLAGLVVTSWPRAKAAEETHRVAPQRKGARPVLDGQVSETPAEEVPPEGVEKVGNLLTIVTRTFLPPTGSWRFKDFGGSSPTYVDVFRAPGALDPVKNKDTDTEIKVTVDEVPATTAEVFPVRCEGNLRAPSGGKKQEPPYWRAKMGKYRLVIKNPCDANGDGKINDPAHAENNYTGSEFTYTTATPGVLTIPVRVEITPDTPEVRADVQDKVRIRIDAINDSHGAGGCPVCS